MLGRVEHESDIDDELPGKAENRGDEEGVGGVQVLELSYTHGDGSGAACCRWHYEEGLCEVIFGGRVDGIHGLFVYSSPTPKTTARSCEIRRFIPTCLLSRAGRYICVGKGRGQVYMNEMKCRKLIGQYLERLSSNVNVWVSILNTWDFGTLHAVHPGIDGHQAALDLFNLRAGEGKTSPHNESVSSPMSTIILAGTMILKSAIIR